MEAARYGCNILHGPNISNFKEIYKFLQKNRISTQVSYKNQMVNLLDKFFTKKTSSTKIKRKLNYIGQNILKKTYKEVNFIIKKNEF